MQFLMFLIKKQKTQGNKAALLRTQLRDNIKTKA